MIRRRQKGSRFVNYMTSYHSPLGRIILTCREDSLTGLWFEGQKNISERLTQNALYIPAAARRGNMTDVPVTSRSDSAADKSVSVYHDSAADVPAFIQAFRWLDLYFAGKDPGFTPALTPEGTRFRQEVWRLLLAIPYGTTTTYGKLAALLAQERGQSHMSAQAVGGAVGHNPISLIIPCHRVIGADGSLTGYAGGIDRKRRLLSLERQVSNRPVPLTAALL